MQRIKDSLCYVTLIQREYHLYSQQVCLTELTLSANHVTQVQETNWMRTLRWSEWDQCADDKL